MVNSIVKIRAMLYWGFTFSYNTPNVCFEFDGKIVDSSLNEAWFEGELCMHVYSNFFVEGTILPEMNRLYGETYD